VRPAGHREGRRLSANVLVRGLFTAEEVPALLTSSQTVKRSLRLTGIGEPRSDQRFRWAEACWWARQGLNL
jgi:hypothetical protein